MTPGLPIPESYWVLPGRFLAGQYPGGFVEDKVRLRLDGFLAAGIDTFLDLTGGNELPPYEAVLREQARIYEKEVRVLHFPITDFGLPTRSGMTATLDAIDNALAAGRKVYVHCWAGVGRTGTVVGCYLVRHGRSGAQALAQIAEWWANDPRRDRYKRSPETDAQVKFILDWK